MGIHHGLAQLVGGRTGIPHGLANAIILPHAIRYNELAVPDAVVRIGEAIGGNDHPADTLTALVERMGLPTELSSCGVTEDDLDAVARLSQSNVNVQANPRPVSEDEARAVLQAAF
jgi:alcohol dehydrogenase class IV